MRSAGERKKEKMVSLIAEVSVMAKVTDRQNRQTDRQTDGPIKNRCQSLMNYSVQVKMSSVIQSFFAVSNPVIYETVISDAVVRDIVVSGSSVTGISTVARRFV